MKRIIATLLALVAAMSMAVSASAAPGVSAMEQEVLDALSAIEYTVNGKTVKLPAEYYNQAQEYFVQYDTPLTADLVAKIKTLIADMTAAAEKAQVAWFGELSYDEYMSFIARINEIIAAVDPSLKLYYTYHGPVYIVKTVTGADGATYNTTVFVSRTATYTGFDSNNMIIALAVLAVAVAGSAVVVFGSRKRIA